MKITSGDDVIYTSMSVSPVIIVPQGLFLLELQKVLYGLQVDSVRAINSHFPYLSSSPLALFLFSAITLTDLSSLGSFVLIMLAHSAVHW